MNTTKTRTQFAVCVDSNGHDDLQSWKVYRVLPDKKAEELGCLRVIDESGEDYLYPAARFVLMDLPEKARTRLLREAKKLGA
jgi:hypothetical protein